MKRLAEKAVLAVMPTVVVACGFLTPGPERVAQDFWDASVDGDFETASEYVTESSRSLMDRAEDAPEVEDVELGDAAIEGDRATVPTTLTAIINDRPFDLEFETVLEREGRAWKVDLRATSGQMISQVMGGAAGEFMSQIGESLGQQMGGMMEGLMKGLAEGMEEMGKGIQQALDSANANR